MAEKLGRNFHHVALNKVDSTNAECMRRAVAGETGNLWITAKNQTAGKGRRGRDWLSMNGNLFASLLLIDPAHGKSIVTLPFVASLAVANAITNFASKDQLNIAIKWPNDVLIGGSKVSGILLEATIVSGGRQAVVIGFGINCIHAPVNVSYPTTSLKEQGIVASADQVFAELQRTMGQMLDEWNRGKCFDKIRKSWLHQAVGIGKPIVARLEDHEKRGVFLDIDADGYLLLETDKGVITISAADIFFQNTIKTDKNPS